MTDISGVTSPKPIKGVTDTYQSDLWSSPVFSPTGFGGQAISVSTTGKANTPTPTDNPYKGDLLNPFKPVTNPYLWRRIGIGVLGGLFIWWGILAFLATNKKIQSTIISAGKGALAKTPEGAVANVATGALS